MLYLLTMGHKVKSIFPCSLQIQFFVFFFSLLQIKYEATVTVYHSPVHICWRKTPWARNGKRWSFHPGPRWTLAGEQECMRGRKTQRKTKRRGKINGVLCRAAKWSSCSRGQEHVFACEREQNPFGHHNSGPITPATCFPSPTLLH